MRVRRALPRVAGTCFGGVCVVVMGAAVVGGHVDLAHAGPPTRGSDSASICAAPGGLSGPAPRVPGTGDYRFPVATRSAEAQRYFDQGLVLAWGFNFPEAVRSFRQAARLDPDCAMCRWGVAYALGPSINHDMTPAEAPAAWEAIVQARVLGRDSPLRERALIEALAARYHPDPIAEREALDAAYASAMEALAARLPDDADVAMLAAEAILTAYPRDYWTVDGTARPWTTRALALLRRALAHAPRHPGAHHYVIHVYEDSPSPERALASAEVLRDLVPGVGHLVHMPAHVYLRLGRYHDAVRANADAVEADRRYLRATLADPGYAAGYILHNYHFLWAAAMLSGEKAVALDTAAMLARLADPKVVPGANPATFQHFRALPLYTLARFGRWDEALAAARPEPFEVYTDAAWRFARGLAAARTGKVETARRELRALEVLAAEPALVTLELKNMNALASVLVVASQLLRAEVAAAGGDPRAAISHARDAVVAEERLEPDEPPAWQIPSRHTLGALLLEAGEPAEAEKVYRADLRSHPDNGWALSGLVSALALQGRDTEALDARRRLERAWSNADVVLPSSRF